MAKSLVRSKIYQPSENGTGGGVSSADFDFNGNRPISRATPGIEGVTPGGDDLKTVLENVLYPAVAPIATISIDRPTREIGENPNYTLTWAVTKKTNPIVSILVDGQAITVSGLSQNGTKNGTFSAITGTFSRAMSVTDGGGLSDSENVIVTYLLRMFWGTTEKNGTSQPISDADILALASSELRSNRLKSFTNFGGGSTRLIFAIPTAFGTPQFLTNGLANTAFTKVRTDSDFVNQQAATVKMDVWVSDNIYNSPLDSVQIQ
ncbi:MAG: hypothetical protein H7Y13_02290 [Sphingobacteriaceae bacterium]|nr:hypothetical protein [Sphingobacteriaceae bacterium]